MILKNMKAILKKLGCLFEAFIGALFLDYNKISVKDEGNWFENIFVCGPGFQMAQIFVENIFEKHVDWTNVIENDDNYKNILQVKIQKEFKVTPDYVEFQNDSEDGYNMGVYLCIGVSIHQQNITDAKPLATFATLQSIHDHIDRYNNVFIILGNGTHKIKKKAEQDACEKVIEIFAKMQ